MKRRGKKYARRPGSRALAADFTRGFVASGLLSAFQDGSAHPESPLDSRRVLRRALQGGAALAAGSAAAEALTLRDPLGALLAVAAGAATVLAFDQLLRPGAHPSQQEI